MNEAQRNAIREADNYLKAAGLTTYSEMQTPPRGVTIITSRAIDKIVYEHTKLNPNQADDQDLLAGIRKAILALTTSHPAPEVSDAEIDWVASQHTRSVDTPTRFVTDVRATVRAILAHQSSSAGHAEGYLRSM